MLSALNRIDIGSWAENPNVAIEIGRVIEKAYWYNSQWNYLLGNGSDKGIQAFKVDLKTPYRPRICSQLIGDGVKGNADFATNLDNLEILSQTVEPENVGNAMKSEIEVFSAIQNIDFIKIATQSLTDWLQQKRDRYLITALANDFTNCVVCDDANGFKDTSAKNSVKECTAEIKKGDIVNVKALRHAIFLARAGLKYDGSQAFPLKPIRSKLVKNDIVEIQHTSYIILLDTYGINQLRNDPEWISMQKSAGVRGDENRLFNGLVGMIDGCPVIDMGIWTKQNPGFLNSSVSDSDFKENINPHNFKTILPPSAYKGKDTDTCIGALIGASALLFVGNDTTKVYIDKREDLGRKTIVGIDKLMAISKARYEPHDVLANNPYANQDYATIGIFASKE